MNKFTCLYLLFFPLLSQAQEYNFIPQVQELVVGNGQLVFDSYAIKTDAKDLLSFEINYLEQHIQQITSVDSSKTVISLAIKEALDHAEAYTLNIDSSGIHIIGASATGVFYGIQSLLQLFPAAVYYDGLRKKTVLPFISVTDYPEFEWRGLLLDCSRHFMEMDFIKRYVDLLAYHKMNRLHWHMTEDQGWRLEIGKYPLLTEVGAWREDVANEMDGDKYGGYYSKEEIRELVAYAAERHITVVPEIEMPGHSQAALAAYPEYSCTGGPFEVETEWGVFKEIYCAGNPATTEFLKDILDEVMELFPSHYIHIGADEVPKYRWEHCPKCQLKMKKHDLKDAEELQSHFLKEINNHLQANDRVMVGWDEITEGGFPGEVIVQSWRGYDGAKEAIAHGLQTIVSPTSHAYFDYDLKAIDLERVYEFNPIPDETSDKDKRLVLGAECNMWSERAPQETVDSKVFPRLLAMTEVLWTYKKNRDYEAFYQRVQAHYKRLTAQGVKYGFETVPVSATSSLTTDNKTQVELIPGTPDLHLYYSINDEQEIAYQAPIKLIESSTIIASARKNKSAYGEPLTLQFQAHAATNKEYEISAVFSEHYSGGQPHALSDGWRGSTDFRDGYWQGFFGDDLIADFDFSESPIDLNKVSAGFLQYNNSWIFMPTELELSYSEDGVNYVVLGNASSSIGEKERGRHLETITIDANQAKVRYLRLTAKNKGTCPEWHEAAGSKAWLFIDEIIIE